MAASKKTNKQQAKASGLPSRRSKRISKSAPVPGPKSKSVVGTTHPRVVLKPNQDPPASNVLATSAYEPEAYEIPSPDAQPVVVGIGASAGGLDAFEKFFRAMPSDSGMAFVLIPHLDPQHSTHLPELIERYTSMPVHLVTDRMTVKSNNVYIIPPDCLMGILHGKLHLVRRVETPGGPSTISYFMRTLAEDQGERAVCIIFSGMGNDGSQAIRSVKHELGLVLAQDPATAKYPSMPTSAIETGLVDLVLPPERMPSHLLEYASRTILKGQLFYESGSGQVHDNLEKIFLVLRSGTGHDFSSYKRSMVLRRIQRRMVVHHIDQMADYARLISESSEEVKILLEELLIGVTQFFRDPEAFEALKQKALLPLLKEVPNDHVVRAWIPGCSGGEEPYSIAIILHECMQELQRELQVQIFATDIDSYAIEKARGAVYSQSIADDVGPQRLQKYFTKVDQTYRVKASIRQMVVFAPQNVIKDPPFTRLDLVVCRNLLIYFDTGLQKKLLPLFHYTLRPDGVLFLGTSETIGGFTEYFEVADKKWKIFKRRDLPTAVTASVAIPVGRPQLPKSEIEPRKFTAQALSRVVERALLARYAPPCAVVDLKGEVMYIHGRTGGFLEPAAGPSNWNVVEMAREGLKLPLSNAIRKAGTLNSEVVLKGLKVKSNGGHMIVDVVVRPITTGEVRALLLITFEREAPAAKKPGAAASPKVKHDRYLQEMEQELKRTKEHLQTSIEEMETTNEELRSINEEYQSTNEELQSANEELNTSREELQSLNEELETVNTEYQDQIQQLQADYLDLHDLIEGLQVPTVMLDGELRIKRYTSSLTRLINFIATDIGRPFSDIAHQLKYSNLVSDAAEVYSSLTPRMVEAETLDGQWYSISIRPLRGAANTIGGVTISFFDITRQKEIEHQLNASNQRLTDEHKTAEDILDTLREGVIILDEGLCVRRANRTFYDLFQTDAKSTDGRHIYELGNRQWDIPQLRHLLEDILPKRTLLYNYEVAHSFPRIGTRTMMLNARQLSTSDSNEQSILLVIEDVTDKAGKTAGEKRA